MDTFVVFPSVCKGPIAYRLLMQPTGDGGISSSSLDYDPVIGFMNESCTLIIGQL